MSPSVTHGRQPLPLFWLMSLWTSIKYEMHLTFLSNLFSSFFFSAAWRFSSSSSRCLCSSAAFMSAWKVAFFLFFLNASHNYNFPLITHTTAWWSRKQLLNPFTSFFSSFFLLISSISFFRSARWRARASMASEKGRGVSWGQVILLWYNWVLGVYIYVDIYVYFII